MERRSLIPSAPTVRKLPVRTPLFDPDWQTGTYRKWADGFVTRNHWRVIHVFPDKEDCLAETAVIFSKCRHKYYGKVNNPKHFMRIFQTSVNNKWNRYARHDEKYRNLIDTNKYFELADDSGDINQIDGFDHISNSKTDSNYIDEPFELPIGDIAVALAQLPAEAKLAMQRLLGAPTELIEGLFSPPCPEAPWRSAAQSRLIWDQRLDRVIRFLFRIPWPSDGQHSIVTLLRNLANNTN